ncbi:hypothetical protein F1880_009064 [Penicillium rolfsii]|nr:hypothetical protein F1880_009064 [Penicillium rolfsii]
MSEELHMEGSFSFDQSNEPVNPIGFSAYSPSYNATATVTDSSSHSVNDSRPFTHTHENRAENMSYTAEIEPLRPYAIEEPDEELDYDPEPFVQPRHALPCLPDCFERWQRELIDRIDDMEDKSVSGSSSKLSPSQKRGQKRTLIGAIGAGGFHVGSHRSKSKAKLDDLASSVNGLSPKRRRRRSKIPEDNAKLPHVSLHDFRENRDNQSSSSDLPSSSSINTANESALVDEMNID